jgi:hypothetical protein
MTDRREHYASPKLAVIRISGREVPESLHLWCQALERTFPNRYTSGARHCLRRKRAFDPGRAGRHVTQRPVGDV